MRSELAPGSVTLVGGGPGDPDLLTVAAARALGQADVVLIDHLAPDPTTFLRPGAEVIEVGKRPRSADATSQDAINALLIEHARAGRRVVRLKGGDSFVFGRGGEEWLACAEAGIAVEVIPGVTSAVAAPASAGIPVTHRTLTQGFTVVSGHVAPGDVRSTLDWRALAVAGTTLVILMGVKNLPEIVAELIVGGLDAATPAAVVSHAFSAELTVVRTPLRQLPEAAAGISPPSVVVVGDVAALEFTHS
ncbi:MAG: uroporphyrinogen-III C-methyltransferase [Propionibacteriaceae bacterium]|nr:uroporphyrinogen-III C-methyltransferase [Propionibacteriaceae bacterium]